MIHAYDEWVPLPKADIFDTLMALATVSAARDMYEKAAKQMEDFRKEYADFQSPFAEDMADYQNMVNSVQNEIDSLYARGIDPLRSAEGRGALSRRLNAINPALLALMKSNAAMGTIYLQNMAKLMAEDQYSQDAEDFRLRQLGITPFNQFSSRNGAVWNQMSPIQYTSLQQATNDWYKNRTAHRLNEADVQSFLDSAGNPMQYDPNYKYLGWTSKDALDIAGRETPGWQGSFWSTYYRDQAEQQLKREGNANPTHNLIEERLQQNIATSQQGYIIPPQIEADPFALLRVEHQNAMDLENLRSANDAYIESLRHYYNTSENPERGYDWDEQLYLSGLANMFGTTVSDAKENGDNNPQAWQRYLHKMTAADRQVRDNQGSLQYLHACEHLIGLPEDYLITHESREPINQTSGENISAHNDSQLDFSDMPRLISSNALNTEISRGRFGMATSIAGGGIPEEILNNPSRYMMHTNRSKPVVTGFVGGRVRTYVPVIISEISQTTDSNERPRVYYMYLEHGRLSVTNEHPNTGHGISIIFDENQSMGGSVSSLAMNRRLGVQLAGIRSNAIE